MNKGSIVFRIINDGGCTVGALSLVGVMGAGTRVRVNAHNRDHAGKRGVVVSTQRIDPVYTGGLQTAPYHEVQLDGVTHTVFFFEWSLDVLDGMAPCLPYPMI